MAESARRPEGTLSRGGALLLVVASWLLPGLGHWLLRRRVRAVIFLALVLGSAAVGCALQGELFRVSEGRPLTLLGTLASAGSGLIYGALRYLAGYRGDILSRGFEYGTAFLVTAGLMNWLLVLDVWDRARGVVAVPSSRRQDGPGEEDS